MDAMENICFHSEIGFRKLAAKKFSIFDTVEALENSGFPFESHDVTTEDGYILTLHRIPRSKEDFLPLNDAINDKRRIPVLLQHGLWSSSGDWIVTGASHSLAYYLLHNGFDVWLGNARGNLYSRKHQILCPIKNSKDFWNFSWHEMGYYDLSAMVDYILSTTNHKQLYYVGHSLGTTMGFVLLSTRPEYNNKIKAVFALAPIVYLKHLRNYGLRRISNISDSLLEIFNSTGTYSLLPRPAILSVVDNLLSRNSDRLLTNASSLLNNFCSYANESVKKNIKELIMAHISAGTSLKVLAHFAQCVRYEKNFRQYDFGYEKNLTVYGQSEPPNYKLSNITTPVVLFYSSKDWLSTLEDVEQLIEDFAIANKQNLIKQKIELDNFNHLDFIWGSVSIKYVFSHILTYMKRFSKCD